MPLLTLLMTVDVLWCMTAYGVKSTALRNRWREQKESARLPLHGASAVFLNIIWPVLINIIY